MQYRECFREKQVKGGLSKKNKVFLALEFDLSYIAPMIHGDKDWYWGLDRYLTNEPNNSMGIFHDKVIELFSDDFYKEHENWILSDQCEEWIDRLLSKRYMDREYRLLKPYHAAWLIERAFRLYLTPRIRKQKTTNWRQQIIDAYEEGYNAAFHHEESRSEQYFNENYKKP